MPGRASGDCTIHLGMFRGGTKGREWEGVHESSVDVSVHLCVGGGLRNWSGAVGLRSSFVQVPETGETQDPGAATRQAV